MLTRLRILLVAFAATMLMATVAVAAPVPVEPGTLSIDAFPPPEQCSCHATLVDQWSRSMHAQALTDKAYLYKLGQAQEATDGQIGAFCNKCHGPAATMAGEFEAGAELSEAGANGVYCSWCHQVVGTTEPVANTSQLVEQGPFRAQIKDPQAPHPAEYSEFHESAQMCGGCHNVRHPVNGMHLEATFDEWRESPWADEGVTCQKCHMGTTAGPRAAPFAGQACATGPQRENTFAMTFVGANVGQSDAELATAQLQAAAEIAIEVPEIVPPGETAVATVTVTNVGAGHYLPTGLTEVRQMWLEIGAGAGETSPTVVRERRFETILQDDEGNAPVELWEATSIKSDDRIPPRESAVETLTVETGTDTDAITLTAELKYKSLPDEFAQEAGVDNPMTLMASADAQVFGSEAARDAAQQADDAEPEQNTLSVIRYVIIGASLVVIAIIVVRLWRQRKQA